MTARKLLYVNDLSAIRSIPQIPWMDERGLAIFKEFAAKSNCYLEFGSGGSTVYIAKNTNVKNILSVDSDEKWVRDINEAIQTSTKEIMLQYCNIGEVGNWGVPKNRNRVENYWQYMSMPWEYAIQKSLKPDLILIDGRFRVACFLFSLLCAEINTTILFDDYVDRSEYFIVEKFCKLVETQGRMAIFKATKDFQVPEISLAIAKYSLNPD